MCKIGVINMHRLAEINFSRNIQNIVNLSANILSFAIAILIGFFISPYIVKEMGAEANGFIALSNNFISYAVIIKTALNSIGSRFIILAYHNNDFKKANSYYSTLFFGDLFLSIVFAIIGVICVWRLEFLINISDHLIQDVKLLFILIFLNFILSTVTTVFSCAPYIKNKVYLQSIRDIESSVIRTVILIFLFKFFHARIFFLGISILIPGIVIISYNYYYKKILVPELRVSLKDFSMMKIKELLSQGIWNSLSSLGAMLLTSLDLLITNLYIGKVDMGILSVAKTMPGVIEGLGTTMASVFFSAMMIDYSHGDMNILTKTVKQSTLMIGSIVTIPLAFLISYGKEFYTLWMPTMNAVQLHILSVLTCFGFVFFAGANSIGTIFTITLHVKERSIAVFLSGLVSIVMTLILVKYTNLGIYAIAGVSTIVTIVRMCCYIVPQGAKYIMQKRTTFLPVIFKSFLSTLILYFVGSILKLLFPCDTWITLISSCMIFAIIGAIVNGIIVLDKDTRIRLYQSVLKKFKMRMIEDHD